MAAYIADKARRGVTTPEAAPVIVNQLYSLSNCTNFMILSDLIFINAALKTSNTKF